MPYVTFNRILSTASTDFQSVFNYKNTTKRKLFFNAADLLPDPNFSKYGNMTISKNGIVIFDSNDNNKPLKRYSRFPVRNKLFDLERDEEIEINLKSDIQDKKIAVSVSLELDFELDPVSSALVPLDPDDLDADLTSLVDRNTQFQLNKLDEVKNAVAGIEIDDPVVNIDISSIVDKLTDVKTSVDSLDVDPLNIQKLINLLTVKITAGIGGNTFTELKTSLTVLLNGFTSINNLVYYISFFDQKLTAVRNLDSASGELLHTIIQKLRNLKLNSYDQNVETQVALMKNAVQLLPQNHNDVTSKLTDTIAAINAGAFSPTAIINSLNNVISGIANLETDSLGIQNALTSLIAVQVAGGLTVLETAAYAAIKTTLEGLRDGFDIAEIDAAITAINNNFIAINTKSAATGKLLKLLITNLNILKVNNLVNAVSKIVEVKEAVAALPQNHTGIVNKLTDVNNSVVDISLTTETIPKAIMDIETALTDNNNSALYNVKLNLIKTGLVNLRDGFDIAEIETLIETMISNLPDVRTNDSTLGILLDTLFINLEITANTINQKITVNGELFSNSVRTDSDVNVLFNLKNSRNLVVGVDVETLTPIPPNGGNSTVNGDLVGSWLVVNNNPVSVTYNLIWDFGSIRNISLAMKAQFNDGGNNENGLQVRKFQVKSNLTDEWETLLTSGEVSGANNNYEPVDKIFRYFRISSNFNQISIYQVWDKKSFLGSAKLTLEIKTADDNWITHLPYTTFGIIYYNSATFTKNIDSIVSFIPSSDSDVRFRLVSTGGLKIGVSALRFN